MPLKTWRQKIGRVYKTVVKIETRFSEDLKSEERSGVLITFFIHNKTIIASWKNAYEKTEA